MYPVSQAYLDALQSDGKRTRITGTITLKSGDVIALSSDDFKKAPEITNQCSGDNELILGQAYQGQLKFTFYSNLSRYQIYDAVVELSKGTLVNDSWFEIPLGRFVVSECTLSGLDALAVTALDEIEKMKKKFESDTVSGRPYDILNYVCTLTGLTLGQTRSQIEALPNGTKTFSLPSKPKVSTYLDIAGDIAALMAGFCTMGRDGKLYVRTFSKSPCRTISADHRGKDTIPDFEVQYTKITCKKSGKTISVGTSSGQIIDLNDNVFLQTGSDSSVEEVLENVINEFNEVTYVPAALNCNLDDPSIELGDLVAVTGYTAGERILVPIHKYAWKWRGNHKIVAVGKDPHLAGAKSKESKELELLQEQVQALELVLLQMSNTTGLIVDDQWRNLARITFSVDADKTLAFNGSIRINMIVPGTVHVKYTINNEDYYFQNSTQHPIGINTITLFVPISVVSSQLNSLDIFIKSDDGEGSIEPLEFRGVVMGAGIIGSSWDGKVDISDFYSFPIHGSIDVSYADSVPTITLLVPDKVNVTDEYEQSIHGGMSVDYEDDIDIIMRSEVYNRALEDGTRRITEDERYRVTEGGIE